MTDTELAPAPEIDPGQDILEEDSQRSFDLASLYENIRVARSDLAAVKIQFYLSRGGVRGFEHPNQWRNLVRDKRTYLDALLRMAREVEAGGAVPEPFSDPVLTERSE